MSGYWDKDELGECGSISWLRAPLDEGPELRELRQWVVDHVRLGMGGNTPVDEVRRRWGAEAADWAKGQLSDAYHRIEARRAEAERYRDCWMEFAIEAGALDQWRRSQAR
jgi:hypothetical protein